jgi:hypothetical protein
MNFHKDLPSAQQDSPFEPYETCMCCGDPANGPLVGYDMNLPSVGHVRALFHRDCAFAMAQRMICDAWPNRRAGEQMTTSVI